MDTKERQPTGILASACTWISGIPKDEGSDHPPFMTGMPRGNDGGLEELAEGPDKLSIERDIHPRG